MIKTKYGQAPLRHSKKGVIFLAFTAVVRVYPAGSHADHRICKQGRGEYPDRIHRPRHAGVSFMGLLLGVRGFRERDKNYITCKVGDWRQCGLPSWTDCNIHQGAVLNDRRKI